MCAKFPTAAAPKAQSTDDLLSAILGNANMERMKIDTESSSAASSQSKDPKGKRKEACAPSSLEKAFHAAAEANRTVVGDVSLAHSEEIMNEIMADPLADEGEDEEGAENNGKRKSDSMNAVDKEMMDAAGESGRDTDDACVLKTKGIHPDMSSASTRVKKARISSADHESERSHMLVAHC